ncbi:MAG: hypothetical protein WC421_01050 [Elusimicrobiales bacterium]
MSAKIPKPEHKNSPTGRYVYDKKLGKVVKISEDIPSLKKSGGHANCGGPCCSGGGCPSMDDCSSGCCGAD